MRVSPWIHSRAFENFNYWSFICVIQLFSY